MGGTAGLVLGPILRRVTDDTAIIWVQTDRPAVVTVTAGPATGSASTHALHDHHFACVRLENLPPGQTPYEVTLDGALAWPVPDAGAPSVIRVAAPDATEVEIAFGSCRQGPAYDDPRLPPDALAAYARRARGTRRLPDLLLLIGDQIYADELPSAWQQRLGRSHVVTFAEYAALYRDAWSEPDVRWLLSTVPTYMIFDDHEVADDWNSSAASVAAARRDPHWPERITAAFESYWVFQHAGNLPDGHLPLPAELSTAQMTPSHRTHSRLEREPAYTPWSFEIETAAARVLVLDNRAGRVLEGERSMLSPQTWQWLRDRSRTDRHLLVAGPLPWLLAPAIHDAEVIWEAVGRRWPGGFTERIRAKFDFEHWSSIEASWRGLRDILTGARDSAVSVTTIGGDVHHSYVARTSVPGLLQVTCSPLRNRLSPLFRTLLEMGWWRLLAWPSRALVRLLRLPTPGLRWRTLRKPWYGSAIGTIVYNGQSRTVVLEGAAVDGTLVEVVRA
ncbi:MAG: alkaline phosphatase family protein [Hamadaea sp.]|nr:alkaline phosphatase family protein [Hamadaea sp.]